MHRVDQLPYRVRHVDSVAIPTRDGTRLSARLWLGEGRQGQPLPAILEFIPYRKGDMTAMRDAATHGYLAGHGYACVRLDVRGTGDSEGIYGDQFSTRYAEDACDAIDWISRQSWCTGAVAMFGLSWGGAIALQTAALAPPQLKAIVCSAGIDDRYDMRMPGGCLSTATLSAVVAQMSYATRPPDPQSTGPAWRSMWLRRLQAARPILGDWLAHPSKDAYWLASSLAPDYQRVRCPALLSAGFADPAFATAMLRTLSHLKAPAEGIFGPWAHRYPHLAIPGPAIGYLQETVRFLDRWLKGVSMSATARLRAFVPSDYSTSATPMDRSGRWISEPEWPAAATHVEYSLGPAILADTPQPEREMPVPSGLLVAENCGEIMPLFGSVRGEELPGDQRQEDARSLVFDSPPLQEPIELLGIPSVELVVASDEPLGQIVMRLCDVAPDGRSRRLSWGARNLAIPDDPATAKTHRAAGGDRLLTVPLNAMADTIGAGHRIRLAISASYWPLLWPSPRPGRTAVRTGASRLTLPLRIRHAGDTTQMLPAEAAPGLGWTELRPARFHRLDERDPVTGLHVLTLTDDMGEGRIDELGICISETTTRRFTVDATTPSSASLQTSISFGVRRGDWSASTRVEGRVSAETGVLSAEHSIEARDGAELVHSQTWSEQFELGP